ncbi:hypothetical protein FQR65_LT09765 [Abscondita terminalis]|nr:hypothetical protein FQR65_LT09765 [Abscondita terminalis]
MNVESLINEIYKRMALWNQAHPDHHNRYILEKQWLEVAEILGTTADAAKNKWKYLRDTFRKELAKIPKPKSGDAGTFTLESRWKYFKMLLYLRDQFTPRKSISNLTSASKTKQISSVSATVSTNDDEMDDDSEGTEKEVDDETTARTTDTVSECDTQTNDYLLSPGSSTSGVEASKEPRVSLGRRRKRKSSSDLIGKALLNVETEKLKILEAKQTKSPTMPTMNEDMHFFESLLPHVIKMNPLRKLQFRGKVQDLVMFFAYNYSSDQDQRQTSFSSSTTPHQTTMNYHQHSAGREVLAEHATGISFPQHSPEAQFVTQPNELHCSAQW